MSIQCQIGCHCLIKDFNSGSHVSQLLNELNIDHNLCYVLHRGRKIEGTSLLEDGNIYHIIPRVLGGKGGFGSMLRAIGAQIEKTTSREACRDLSGRRMRDVNNEKKLKDWLAKESDREREKAERKQEKLAAQLAGPKHKFDDPEYHKQRSKVQEDLDDALQKGLKRSVEKNGDASSSTPSRPVKKVKTTSNKEWLGMDIDSDDLDSDSDNEANPGSPGLRESEIQSMSCKDQSGSDSLSNTSGKDGDKSTEAVKGETSKSDILHGSNSNDGKIESNTKDKSINATNNTDDDDKPIDLDEIISIDDLTVMSLNRLKNALTTRGLKCGGTLEERAERLFSVKGLSSDQIPTSLMAKSKGVGKKSK